MNEDEDLELLALQRRLDDAFNTTRPRRGFEDELWLRLQSRRPVGSRLADAWTGLIAALKQVPPVPTAAVAAVLIVVIGAGALTWGALNSSHGAGTASLGARAPQFGSDQFNSGAGAAPSTSFGLLPPPALSGSTGSPTDVAAPDESLTPKALAKPANLYFGPATLTWTGQLNVGVVQAPVFRFQEPTVEFANVFAAKLGVSPQSVPATSGYLGTYSGQGLTISVRGSTQSPPGEPFYVVTVNGSAAAPAGNDPLDVASRFLQLHGLIPTWLDSVTLETTGDRVRVNFLRTFMIPAGTSARLVDGAGEPYGVAVEVTGGRVIRAAGPLPLGLGSAEYPIISAKQAVISALASGPSGPATITPTPAVELTSAELVYSLVWAGDHSFYEPAYLFSGTFEYNGAKYIKRVLVPAVDPSYRSA